MARARPRPIPFDWKAPDYGSIYAARNANLDYIEEHPEELPTIRDWYKKHPADFIDDWGMTYDPRNAEVGLSTTVPFVLFPRQREWVDWLMERWASREPGLTEKSRDGGFSWLAMSLACTLCIFHEGLAIGVGSRKTEYVDKVGTYKPLIPKGRMFMEHLPVQFRAGYEAWRDAPFMRMFFPDTRSLIGGEGGDDIGRGDRTAIYFLDESAHHPKALLIEAALSQTTNCRIDISSVNGMNNPFAQKRFGGKISLFIFDWRQDPRKDQAWYEKQQRELDPVVVAQEIDRDYGASVHGILIPSAWVRSAIDARRKLGIAPQGRKGVALDVADEGLDKNAICVAQGIEVERSEEWSGKGSDIFSTVERAFEVCDEVGVREFRYDADGLGAGVRGDARVINDRRKAQQLKPVAAVAYRGSGEVHDPEGIVEGTMGSDGDKGRTNQDYFANRKAQAWFSMRRRFMKTHRWVVEGIRCDPAEIVSISPACPNHLKLVAELSQPTYSVNLVGKMVINKKPDGMKSPNLADAAVEHYAPMEPPPFEVTQELLASVASAMRRQQRR